MIPFLCDYLNEIVILSDGRVTTCCLDPLGVNVFGSIYEQGFEEVRRIFKDVRSRITYDVESMPRCRICYGKIKDSGFPQTGTYKIDPTSSEIELFIAESEEAISRLVIELSSRCNLGCNGCMQSRVNFSQYRRSPFLDISRLESWLVTGVKTMKHIRLYNYGETFMHTGAIGFCSSIKKHRPGVFVEIATNGMLLNTDEKRRQLVKAGIDSLVFSIHGGSQGSTEIYMTEKFNFEVVLDILRGFVAIKRELGVEKPKLLWKYLLFEWNDSDAEIGRARRLSEQVGVDGLVFDLVGYPSPSRRFTRDSQNWSRLKTGEF